MRRLLKWSLLIAATVAVTYPLTLVGVPSAALFAALVVGIALALLSLAPTRIPRPTGVAAQGVLGVYIGTMVHQDAVDALGPHWPIVAPEQLAPFSGPSLARHVTRRSLHCRIKIRRPMVSSPVQPERQRDFG